MKNEETQTIVSQNNAALLLLDNVDGRPSVLLDSLAAGKLLGRISAHLTGQGSVSYLIPEVALKEAGVNMANWQKAEMNGMVSIREIDGKRQFELLHEVSVGEHFVVNTLIEHLETLSGITYAQAHATAQKFVSQPGTGQAISNHAK